MQREAQQVRRPRNTQGANVPQRQRQEDQRASAGLSYDRWTDPEISVFLQEWEHVEQEVGHPGRKIHKKTRLICQHLRQRGLRKSWTSCFNLLLTMQNLHKTLCDKRPGIEPLFSPYAEALYRILGPRDPRSQVPDPPYEGAGNLQFLMHPPPPMAFLPPEYQPWSLGIQAPSGEPEWNPPLTMSTEGSLVPR
ncbi:putative uncharacterized protein MSANTD5 [Acomys russatus]|uniref:putative uncharacterized protein MSANTD5 n=1 Tax=Acomys russatus TaxID=60746 RepID=UPI0021E2DB64|nr:putative uncharacterized protein MSANTD5 [Acomys russatus]